MLGVPDGTEVTVQPLDEDRLGYYSAASRQIVLSRSVLESGSAQETMDTIAHEAFHVQQAYVVENIDWDDAATQAAYYDQARRWLRNYQNGYVSARRTSWATTSSRWRSMPEPMQQKRPSACRG